MDGVSRGLLMRVAVCGWDAVRGRCTRARTEWGRRERERSASAEGGQGARRLDEAWRAHEGAAEGGRGSDDD